MYGMVHRPSCATTLWSLTQRRCVAWPANSRRCWPTILCQTPWPHSTYTRNMCIPLSLLCVPSSPWSQMRWGLCASSVCLSVFLSLFLCLSVHLCLSFSLSVCPSLSLFLCLSVHLSLFVSVPSFLWSWMRWGLCVSSVCLSVFLSLFLSVCSPLSLFLCLSVHFSFFLSLYHNPYDEVGIV